MPSFVSNIRFVYFRTKGVRAQVNFPAIFFLYFVARIAQTSTLFLWITQKINSLNEKHLATWEHKHVYFDLLGYQLKKLLKK